MSTASLRNHIMSLPRPMAWDDLRQDQYTTIVGYLNRYAGPELLARITWTLLDISWRTPRRLAALFVAFTPEARHTLTGIAKPFVKPDTLLCTPLKELHAGHRTLVCAYSDMLNQVDAETWGLVDTAFMRFNRTRDMDLLRAMAQGLYALPGTSRDQRLYSNASAELVKMVPHNELLALHVMWAAHRIELAKDAPWVFRTVNQRKAERRKGGWNDVLLAMSGSKFGPFREVCTTPARVFLRQLSLSIEEATQRKHKAEAERNQRHARR